MKKDNHFEILPKIKNFKKLMSRYSYKNDFLNIAEKKELSKELFTLIMFLKIIEKEINNELKKKEQNKINNYYI